MLLSTDIGTLHALIYITQDPGRIAGHDRVGWYIFRDNAAGADDRILADGDVGQNGGARTDRRALRLMTVRSTFQSLSVCSAAASGSGPRIAIVDECHSVPNEDVVFDRDPFADEGVAGDLAALADAGVLLDLDKGADLRLVSDFASIEIDELGEPNVLPELDIRRDHRSL